ncbi:MauE/DoxX family redox-associated membrane protein [Rossellomorea yichunensis]|uniref:MauE/DoxX family redox-associated membrane protein n=1 Tax=Rossellomorea yichunensis TaxID=3077331 RepID=UPI0028DFE3B5|nr:MauE/DoxX family redox-associated membrane protein [Rossellomorea sp. YC4-1]MDT9027799.1 MauE/DoxX family redox-associated membrane protein [Rossellomorea sp. YC4-1]
MSEYIFLIKFIFLCLFLSSAYSHLNNFDSLLLTIKRYQIVPNKLVVFSALAITSLEILISALLLTNISNVFVTILILGLLSIFTIALVIILIRGDNNINCGCGGLVGNHKINRKLVFRNILLIILSIFMLLNISTDSNNSIFVMKNIQIICSVFSILFSVLATLELIKLNTNKVG